MYVKHVRTNAKIGADTALGPKTLIVGPNGSGKSTILNAVELALTSRVSDVAGRVDVAREADVMQLAPRGDALFAEVKFDTGEIASYVVEGTTAKAKKAQVERPQAVEHDEVLPIRTLREALLGSPATARKYLLGKVAGAVTREDIEALMPDDLKEAWRTAVAKVPQTTAAPDALVAVLERAGAAQREANAEVKSAREASKLVTGGRAAPPTKAEITTATKTRDAAREAWQKASSSQSATARRAKAREALDHAVKHAEAALFDAASLAATAANLSQPVAPHPVFPHVCEVLKESLAQGECLVCGAGKPDATALKFLEEELKTYKRDVEAKAQAEAKASVARRRADDLVQAVERLEAEIAGDDGPVEAPIDVDAAKTALDAAEAALTELKVVADAWASARKAEGAAKEAEERAKAAKGLKEACEEAVGTVLGKALAAFISTVQGHLPEGDAFDLRLQDGDREVVQFGLVRAGVLITALSGAEWARVLAAMASACVPAGKPAVVIPEERAFDPNTLAEVLEAFAASPHQVLLASPIAPSRVPAGWTVVVRG